MEWSRGLVPCRPVIDTEPEMPDPRRTALGVELLEARDVPAVITVTSTADTVLRDGVVTLREAILAADTRQAVGDVPAPGSAAVVIKFAIPGTGLHTITPRSALPAIMAGTTLDATTQPGYAGNPVVELNGSLAGTGVNGLTLSVGGNVVRGLLINRFSGNGIDVASGGNTVAGCWVGMDATGYRAAGNGANGILVTGAGNTIGGTGVGARVVVGGNRLAGIDITGSQAAWNQVVGDYIGTDFTGFASVPNGTGILICSGAHLNTVGGPTRASRNVVAGNVGDQLCIAGTGASANVVQGNYLGVDSSGESGSLSGGSAVKLAAGATGNVIGGTALGTGNLISGAGHRLTNGVAVGVGIEIDDAGTTRNVIQGNWVGLDARGCAPITNQAGGILIKGATGNTIGGTGTAQNVVGDPVNSPGLAASNRLLPAYWYVDTLRYLGHPELVGGSFRA